MSWEVQLERDIPWTSLESIQSALASDIRRNPSHRYLLVSEPKATFTFGRFATREDLLWSAQTLKAKGASVHAVSRGGKWTYHGPGQLLIYPLVQLGSLGLGSRAVHQFLLLLRSTLMDWLRTKHLICQQRPTPFGIYVGDRKLVSFGIAVQRGVTLHGLALYWKDQSDYFKGIHPCGMPGERVTSLEELGVKMEWEEVARELIQRIKICFKTPKKSLGLYIEEKNHDRNSRHRSRAGEVRS